MARKFSAVANEYVTIPSIPAAPLLLKLTFGCWFLKDSIPATNVYHTLFCKGALETYADRHFSIDHRLRSSVEHLEIVWTQPASTYVEYYAPVTLQVGRYYHLVISVDWTTNPDTVALYLDGRPLALSLSGSNNSTPTTGGTQTTRIGHAPVLGSDKRWVGNAAQAFLLSDTITSDEAFDLARGRLSPADFAVSKPSDVLEFYLPLKGPPIDLWRGRDGVFTGTTLSDDPPNTSRAPRSYFLLAGATGGTVYTLTADAGSFALTGTAATLKAARSVAAAAGSYAVAGTDASLKVGHVLAAGAGAYALTGTDAALTATRTLAADSAAYTVAGTAAALTVTRSLSADAGAFVWAGTAAALSYSGSSAILTALPGAFAWSGTDAALRVSRVLQADAGAYSVTGTAAGLRAARVLAVDAGSYAWAGTAAGLRYGRGIVADSGAYVLLGTDAAPIAARLLSAGPGAYLWTGTDAALWGGTLWSPHARPGASRFGSSIAASRNSTLITDSRTQED